MRGVDRPYKLAPILGVAVNSPMIQTEAAASLTHHNKANAERCCKAGLTHPVYLCHRCRCNEPLSDVLFERP